MAEDTPNGSQSRVVIRVSKEMQFLLTQVAARMLCNKKDLHDAIWRAGVQAHLGVTPEQIEEEQVTSLPRSAAAKDPRQLVKMMLKR